MNHDTAGVGPAILDRHPGLDEGQRELIGRLEGPTLGIAGPGSGKTLAVALRGANILLQGKARPEELVLCTYSRAAARELRQRFIRLATGAGCPGDPSRVRIGTIHGLCGRILRSHAHRAGLGSDFKVLNEDEQWRLLSRYYAEVFGSDLHVLEGEGWRWQEPHLVIRHGCKYFERICDELIAPDELIDSGDPFHAALGRCYLRYRDLLLDEGRADFDHLQRWAAELLEDDRIADPIADGTRYLICDEYQDTSAVQERLLQRLSRSHGNICVVGDDDQAIYRFRGASVRSLLEFPDRFANCHTVELGVNYRSHPDIVRFSRLYAKSAKGNGCPRSGAAPHMAGAGRFITISSYPRHLRTPGRPYHPLSIVLAHTAQKCVKSSFYDGWMATAADWSSPDAGGRPFRYPKSITPHDTGAHREYPAVIAVEGRSAGNERRQLVELVEFLKGRGVIARYDQVALLLHSVQGASAVGYLDALEGAGIAVNRAPSGTGRRRRAGSRRGLTVTTIHQAKGREWDVVIVGSLNFDNPDVDPVGRELAPYVRRPAFEPADRIAEFDHARQHYVAFSRPRSLLVLTASGRVHPRFEDAWERLPRWDRMDRRALARQRFRPPESSVDEERAQRPVRVIPYLRRLDVWLGRAAAATGAMPQRRKDRRP